MFSKRRAYLMISSILIFEGCNLTNTDKDIPPIPKTQKTLIKELPLLEKKVENSKNNQKANKPKIKKLKKPIIKKVKKKVVKKPKKTIYHFCTKHTKIMAHASKYIKNEFEKGYFNQKDILGAQAQLFLIESKSNSIFSKNINQALNAYNSQYSLAKKNKCNLNKFKIPPLLKIKNKIQSLKKEGKK